MRFALAHPSHFIALGFGAGLVPFAPGTMGTLLALALWQLVPPGYGPLEVAAAIAALFGLGVWACERTGRVLAIVPQTLAWQTAAFVLFRGFDIFKPPPIRDLERRFKGGFGVMVDDLAAAGYTLLVLALARRLLQALA
jgi:phosphatidylglycerophosphatase A